MEKEVKKIIVKTSSGYCPESDAFEEKIEITSNSVTCERIPGRNPSSNNEYRKWSYKTNSKFFHLLFGKLVNEKKKVLDETKLCFAYDFGDISITYVYKNKTRDSITYSDYQEEQLRTFLEIIREMVPNLERFPEVVQYIIDDDEE